MNNQENNENNYYYDNTIEKKAIIYLIVLALILIYTATFFIHNIVDKGTINKNGDGTITIPEDNTVDINDPKPEAVDFSDRIIIKDNEGQVFTEGKELDIFKNYYYGYNDNSIIAPGVNGVYSFTVENEAPVNFTYDINLSENNKYNINLKFRLKLNGEYILGDENTWGDSSALNIGELPLNSNKKDIYTIEWQWPYEGNDEQDTKVGETEGANYKLKIEVVAKQIIEQ